MKILKNGKPVKSSCFCSKVFEKKKSKEHGERALHPLHAPFFLTEGQAPSAPQREDVEISIQNVTLQLKVRSGRIYCILAASRLIGSNCLLFTQKFLLHVNKSPSLPRTHTISALFIQEFQLLDISPLPQHLSLVNTVLK